MSVHLPILERIRRAGYAVSEHHLGDMIEMRAVLLVEPHTQHIASCTDGDGPIEAELVSRELARMVGIDEKDA